MSDKLLIRMVGDPNRSKEAVLIPALDSFMGMFGSLNNAIHFLNSAKTLESAKDYQSAIPLATISIEESLKSSQLLHKLPHGLTKDAWNDMKKHRYKLSWPQRFFEKFKKENITMKDAFEEIGIHIDDTGAKDLTSSVASNASMYTCLQKLRECCFYGDWDEDRGQWVFFDRLFNELPEDSESKLAYYVIHQAEFTLNGFLLAVEYLVNKLRRSPDVLEKSRYLQKIVTGVFSYTEYRTFESFDSIRAHNVMMDNLDIVKCSEGVEIIHRLRNNGFIQHSKN